MLITCLIFPRRHFQCLDGLIQTQVSTNQSTRYTRYFIKAFPIPLLMLSQN
jgi:hypothetical protein